MDLREIGSCGVDPEGHWYYKTKKRPMIDFFRESLGESARLDVFDIGAGSGFFSERLMAEEGDRVGDVCQIDDAFSVQETLSGERIRGKLRRARTLPGEFRGALLLMMDVLEHVEDDLGLLQSVVERCRGRNYLFITAPASMSLWSSHDDFLGHRRRYELGALRAAASRAGIKITSAYYLYGLIFPLVWLVRRRRSGPRQPRSDLRPQGRLVSLALEWLCRCEFVFRRRNRYFGVTCVLEGVVDDGAAVLSNVGIDGGAVKETFGP